MNGIELDQTCVYGNIYTDQVICIAQKCYSFIDVLVRGVKPNTRGETGERLSSAGVCTWRHGHLVTLQTYYGGVNKLAQ